MLQRLLKTTILKQYVKLSGMLRSINLTALLMVRHYFHLSLNLNKIAFMSIHTQDYKRNYKGSGVANLSRLLLELVKENHPYAVNLQLTSSVKGNELATWHLKSQTDEQHSD